MLYDFLELGKLLQENCINSNFKLQEHFVFIIDNFLYNHSKHLYIRKKIKKLELDKENFSNSYSTFNKLAKKQDTVNKYLLSFFILLIIEISKLIEEDGEYKSYLDKNIKIEDYQKYRRVKREKYIDISNITELITHYRDANVHTKLCKISENPLLLEYHIKGHISHLEFVCDGNTNEWIFIIGGGVLYYKEILRVIIETLKFYQNPVFKKQDGKFSLKVSEII